MPIKKAKQINLLPQEEFETSDLGRILKWALSSFRIMVIITELVVMSAFLSRFWLDSRNSDLNDELSINKAQVMAYSEVENQFTRTQKKIEIAKSLYSEPASSELISTISNSIPTDISLLSISASDKELQIKAEAFSERSIALFLVNLESNKLIKEVTLTQVSSSTNNAAITIFTITAGIENKK